MMGTPDKCWGVWRTPTFGNKIVARRMKLAGHCHSHSELAASDLVLWQPNQNLKRRPKVDFVEVLRQDAGNLTTTELRTVMEDQTVWRNHVTACGWPNYNNNNWYLVNYSSRTSEKSWLFQIAVAIMNFCRNGKCHKFALKPVTDRAILGKYCPHWIISTTPLMSE